MDNLKTTQDYVTKYNLDKTNKFNHRNFVKDLKCDFNVLLTDDIRLTGPLTPARFESAVKKVKMKFDAISNKVKGDIDYANGLWKYFFANVIVEKRDSFFPKDEL